MILNALCLPRTAEVTDIHIRPMNKSYKGVVATIKWYMKFKSTTLRDVWLIELEPAFDNRGFFARTFCVEEFAAHGLETSYAQHSISFSTRKGALRGYALSARASQRSKACALREGSIWDVIIDIRPDLPNYLQWQGFDLSSSERISIIYSKGVRSRLPNT